MRRILWITSTAALIILALSLGILWLLRSNAGLGSAYAAKILASGVFVAGRSPESMLSQELGFLPRINYRINNEEKTLTAYHEAGHTLMAWLLPGAHRVHKVTIVPRGRSLGSTQTMPAEDRLSMSESELRDHLVVLLGGRAAEKLVYAETTVGAENDLERATSMARRMVTHWGMSEQLGPVSYKMSDEDPFLGREIHQQRQFSEHTMELIDAEVARILHDASEQAMRLEEQHRDKLEAIARELLKREELQEDEITTLIGPSVHASREANGRPHRSQPSSSQS